MIFTPLMLDTGPLAKLVHPNHNAEIGDWVELALKAGAEIVIPAIADYELRRKLLHKRFEHSISRLNFLESSFFYLPIEATTLRRAAELWAIAREQGQPTAPPDALDGDVILAAQAESIGAVVVTENEDDFKRFVPARHWMNISFHA